MEIWPHRLPEEAPMLPYVPYFILVASLLQILTCCFYNILEALNDKITL